MDSEYYLCVDDNGRLKDLPLNPVATVFYSKKMLRDAIEADEYIVGNALIFKVEGRHGDRNLRCLDEEETEEIMAKIKPISDTAKRLITAEDAEQKGMEKTKASHGTTMVLSIAPP